MELWMQSMALEKTKDFFIGSFDGFFFAVWDGFGMNGVAIVVVKDEKVIVTAGGGNDEAPSLVRANVAGDGSTICVDVVGALAGCSGSGRW
jgi:hypothetical protein